MKTPNFATKTPEKVTSQQLNEPTSSQSKIPKIRNLENSIIRWSSQGKNKTPI